MRLERKVVVITGSSSGMGRKMAFAVEKYGKLDVLINNAGIIKRIFKNTMYKKIYSNGAVTLSDGPFCQASKL